MTAQCRHEARLRIPGGRHSNSLASRAGTRFVGIITVTAQGRHRSRHTDQCGLFSMSTVSMCAACAMAMRWSKKQRPMCLSLEKRCKKSVHSSHEDLNTGKMTLGLPLFLAASPAAVAAALFAPAAAPFVGCFLSYPASYAGVKPSNPSCSGGRLIFTQ